MTSIVDDPLAGGRNAVERRAWSEAYALFSEAARQGELDAEDLERLGDAAWWTAHPDEAVGYRERAHAAYLADGRIDRAALVGLRLSQDHLLKGASSVANGWYCRAERLLADQPDSVEHGYLAMSRAHAKSAAGELDASLEHAKVAGEYAKRFRDRDLEAFALAQTGRAWILKGEIDKGLALIDEAATSAAAGELGPLSSVNVYCVMISACQRIGDYQRAGEWTQAANSFCDELDASGYPGMCRVHRAELLRLRGDWETAEEIARRAADQLGDYNIWVAGLGYYELGEILRRKGDFAAAEEAYRRAKEVGHEPQPGLALLRLAQGKVEAATSAIRRALAAENSPYTRVRLLPAAVEIDLAAGDVRSARAAADELETIADSITVGGRRAAAFEATVQTARAELMLHEGDPQGAAACARHGLELWRSLGAPYEVARAQMLLGLAYRRDGDEDGAMEEFAAARGAFERLGAVLDSQRVAELLGEVPLSRTFMFTDIVDSTKLAEALGEAKWQKLLSWHDRTLRETIEREGGAVIKQTGDGFFAAFESANAALAAAVAIQRALDAFDGVAPDVRIGLHAGEAFSKDETDFGGQGVHAAARIGALAGAGQILASRETAGDANGRFGLSEPRAVELKGISDPVDVVAIAWR
ncbi:MAG: hypothetical protein KY396_02270 [Actinobacteria bacterium]|nr:hypothetical protein [Actinomycetota bacterium]